MKVKRKMNIFYFYRNILPYFIDIHILSIVMREGSKLVRARLSWLIKSFDNESNRERAVQLPGNNKTMTFTICNTLLQTECYIILSDLYINHDSGIYSKYTFTTRNDAIAKLNCFNDKEILESLPYEYY